MFEYKILQSNALANEDDLNIFGREGWQLITILENNSNYYYFFFRQLAKN